MHSRARIRATGRYTNYVPPQKPVKKVTYYPNNKYVQSFVYLIGFSAIAFVAYLGWKAFTM